MAWYQDWFNTDFYHQLHTERKKEEKDAFISRLLGKLQPVAGSRLLDAVCGRGRHTSRLAEAGLDVNGIDLSMENISYAQQFERENLHFSMHDLRLPVWVNYFDHAFHLEPFGYYATRREMDDAMHTLAAGLKIGGTLVMDQPNMHYQEAHIVPHEIIQQGATKFEINRWQDELYFFKRIIVSAPGMSQPKEFTEKWMKLSFGDVTDMLSFQKMQVREVYGTYQLEPYHIYQTPRMIVIAKKMG